MGPSFDVVWSPTVIIPLLIMVLFLEGGRLLMFCGLLIGLVASYGFLFLAPTQGSHVLAGQNIGKTMPPGPQNCNKDDQGDLGDCPNACLRSP